MTNSQGRQTQNFFLLLAGWTFRTGKLCQRPKFRKERRIKGKAWKSVFHGSILHIAKPKSLPGPHPLSPLIAMPIPQCSPPLSTLSSSHYLRTIGSSPHTRGSQPPSCTPPTNLASASLYLQVLHSPFRSSSSSFPGHCLPITVSGPIARAFGVCSLNNPGPSTGLGTWFLLSTHLWIR